MRRLLALVPVQALVGLPVVPVTPISVVSTVLPAPLAPVPLIAWPSPSIQTPWRGNARDGSAPAFLRHLVALHGSRHRLPVRLWP